MEQNVEEAIPFIIFNKKNGFEITKESIEFLKTLKDKRLGVISVVGKYRTGKSYFINKALLNRSKKMIRRKPGFQVGSTVNACTKGIWLWSKTLKSENPAEEDLELLIMDTEGFGGVREG